MAYTIFVGWSGVMGKRVAPVLTNWINEFFGGNAEAITSELNLNGGEVLKDIRGMVDRSQMAIFCVSKDGLNSSDIRDEIVRLQAKDTEEAWSAWMLLIGFDIKSKEYKDFLNDKSNPLSKILGLSVNSNEVKNLMTRINAKLRYQLQGSDFDSDFNKKFPELEKKVMEIQSSDNESDLTNKSGEKLKPTSIVENQILGIMIRCGIEEKGYLLDKLQLRQKLKDCGFSEIEMKLALELLELKGYVESCGKCSPVGFSMTEAGKNWLSNKLQDFSGNCG